MPTYEYICLSCDKNFEYFQGINDEPIKICPSCKGGVKRHISGGSGFIIKGARSSSAPPSCGMESPCCGRESFCGNHGECHE